MVSANGFSYLNILPTLDRERIYEEVRRLRAKSPEITTKVLSRELAEIFDVLPSRQTLARWLKAESSPTSSMNQFDASPSAALTFFVGAWIGDGWADQADGGKRLRLQVRSREFAEEFAAAATSILNKLDHPYIARPVHKEDGTWYSVKVTSIALFEFLHMPFNKLTPVLESNPERFLRGFATAEGNPSVSIQTKSQTLAVSVCLSNTDIEYIKFARSQLLRFGYHPTSITIGYEPGKVHPIRGVAYVTTNTEWQFRIAVLEEVERFAAQIGFADAVKQDKTETAARLIRQMGSRAAAVEWRHLFEKRGRKWFRKGESSRSNSFSDA